MNTDALRFSPGTFWVQVVAAWKRVLLLGRRPPRRLRLCESLALGERRFVAVVAFEQARFLVGGTPSALVLLSRLSDAGARAHGEEGPTSSGTNVTRNRWGETC